MCPIREGPARRDVLQGMVVGGSLYLASSQVSAQDTDEISNWRWGGFGGRGNTGATEVSIPDNIDIQRWSVGSDEQEPTSPSFADGTAYCGVGSELRAFDATTGTGGWSIDLSSKIKGTPAIGDEVVFASTEDGSLFAVDRDSGEERWEFGLSGDPGYPSYSDGLVFIGTSTQNIYAFTESGDLEWSINEEVGNPPRFVREYPSPTPSNGSVYVNFTQGGYARRTGIIASLDSETGEKEWENHIDEMAHPPAVTDDYICISTNETLRLMSHTGTELWMVDEDIEHNARTISVAIGQGIVASLSSGSWSSWVRVFDVETGEERWQYDFDVEGSGGIAISNNLVYCSGLARSKSDYSGNVVIGATIDNGLITLERDFGGSRLRAPPVPTPYGLATPADGSMTFFGPESVGDQDQETATESAPSENNDSSSDDNAEDESQDTGGSDSSPDSSQRGIFTNDGSGTDVVDMFTLTVSGFALSVIAIIYQLANGD